VLGAGWTEVVALAAAFAIAVLATPAGISGAVLLLPFQVSVLGTPSPAVTPTNLLYNVVATPGALYRYWRQGQTGGRLALVLIAGTLPGVIAGSVIRVELLPGAHVFDLVVAAVLVPLGAWLALTRPTRPGTERSAHTIPPADGRSRGSYRYPLPAVGPWLRLRRADRVPRVVAICRHCGEHVEIARLLVLAPIRWSAADVRRNCRG
jgi:uncharacterized membrane protein YfcA